MIEQGRTPKESGNLVERRRAIANGLGEKWQYFGTYPLYLDPSNLSAGLWMLYALRATGIIENWELQPALNGNGGNPLPEVDLYIKKRNRP